MKFLFPGISISWKPKPRWFSLCLSSYWNLKCKFPPLLEKCAFYGFRNSETLFTNPGIVSFIPANQNLTEVKLQLNSRVFLYNAKPDLIEISEQYRIKGGPIIGRHIGSWSLNKGILLYNPIVSHIFPWCFFLISWWIALLLFHKMWLRRKDLQGQDIRVASVQYPVVSRIEYDGKGNIIGGSGFFQDILMTLAHESALNFSRTLMPPVDGNVGALVGRTRTKVCDG